MSLAFRIEAITSRVSQSKTPYSQLAKLTEEVGEVAECVVSLQSDARKEKPGKTVDDLAEELADVILACHVLAKCVAGCDLDKALASKVEVVERRIFGI